MKTVARLTRATAQNRIPGSLRSRRNPNITGATIPPKLKPVETKPKTLAMSPGGDIDRMSMSRDGATMPEKKPATTKNPATTASGGRRAATAPMHTATITMQSAANASWRRRIRSATQPPARTPTGDAKR